MLPRTVTRVGLLATFDSPSHTHHIFGMICHLNSVLFLLIHPHWKSPLSTTCHHYSSQVSQPSHIHHVFGMICRLNSALFLFLRHHWSGFPLKTKMSSLQKLIPWLTWLCLPAPVISDTRLCAIHKVRFSHGGNGHVWHHTHFLSYIQKPKFDFFLWCLLFYCDACVEQRSQVSVICVTWNFTSLLAFVQESVFLISKHYQQEIWNYNNKKCEHSEVEINPYT